MILSYMYVPLRTRKALYIFLNNILSVESQKGVNDIKLCSIENQKGTVHLPLRTRKALYIFLNKILSVESQKGVNDIKLCSIENQKGTIHLPEQDIVS